MKTPFIATFAFALLFSGSALAQQPYVTTNHSNLQTHNNYLYPNHYAQNQAPLVNINYNPTPAYNHYAQPKVTTNTATYYSRSYPVTNTYTYTTAQNNGIHHPPYAYSSCANRCDQTPQRITVSRNLGARAHTYRAPSEYSAQTNYVVTPQNRNYQYDNRPSHSVTHVSPYQTHKLTTTRTYGYGYNHTY